MSKADYTDWKLGVTKDIGGWVFGASYVDTNAATAAARQGRVLLLSRNSSGSRQAKNAGKATAVISVSKTF